MTDCRDTGPAGLQPGPARCGTGLERALRRWAGAALFAAVLFLSGCAAVYHPMPLGEEPVRLDPADWDGLWTEPDIGFVIRTVDAEQGLLDVMVIDGETTRSSDVHIRRSGGWLFGSTRDYDPETQTADEGAIPVRPAQPWVFFRVVNRGDTLVLWLPNIDRFQSAVERGRLPGRIEEGEYTNEVFLERLTPEQQRLITESRDGVMMDWEEPIVLRRVIGGDTAPRGHNPGSAVPRHKLYPDAALGQNQVQHLTPLESP